MSEQGRKKEEGGRRKEEGEHGGVSCLCLCRSTSDSIILLVSTPFRSPTEQAGEQWPSADSYQICGSLVTKDASNRKDKLTAARLSVVGEVVTDPLVDLTEGHPFARRAVDGEGDQAGVAVGRLAVSVLCSFLLVQRCSRVQVDHLLARPVPVMVAVMGVSVVVSVVVAAAIGLLDGGPHAELGEPVHGGQAALQLGGHGSRRSKGSKGKGERLGDVAYGGSPVGSLNGSRAAALAQVWKSRRRLMLQISLPQALTCCAAVAVVVEKFGSVGWLHGGTAERRTARL
ncbi:hypothetical protein EYF80_002102 [Liparis tanakae]|uniref:Uncharacterized protein n=1 Tax=Liparis tanakae TaxID=230148 RepID=A0A4Z2JBQ9_9TELE|nr:hypothetical protein EYF80_002102 [Liparis tanakae]